MERTKKQEKPIEKDKVLIKQSLEKELKRKQIVFCHEYIRDWNGTRSAKVAGYSEKSAYAIASIMLRNIKIKAYIDFIQNNIAEEVGISKIQMLQELKCLALSNISDVYSDWITQESFEILKKTNPAVMKAIQEISTKTENMMNADKELIQINYVKIKFYDKPSAIRDIFKAMGWNEPESINVFVEQPLFGDEG